MTGSCGVRGTEEVSDRASWERTPHLRSRRTVEVAGVFRKGQDLGGLSKAAPGVVFEEAETSFTRGVLRRLVRIDCDGRSRARGRQAHYDDANGVTPEADKPRWIELSPVAYEAYRGGLRRRGEMWRRRGRLRRGHAERSAASFRPCREESRAQGNAGSSSAAEYPDVL